jgi:hypothetical protein
MLPPVVSSEQAAERRLLGRPPPERVAPCCRGRHPRSLDPRANAAPGGGLAMPAIADVAGKALANLR